MTLLKIVLNALRQVLTWCASNRAQQFVEDHFREEGYAFILPDRRQPCSQVP